MFPVSMSMRNIADCLAGTKDFLPEDMRLRNWLFGHFDAVSQLFGFEMVEGPVLESEELFTRKAGEEIVGQLYNFEVRSTVPGNKLSWHWLGILLLHNHTSHHVMPMSAPTMMPEWMLLSRLCTAGLTSMSACNRRTRAVGEWHCGRS